MKNMSIFESLNAGLMNIRDQSEIYRKTVFSTAALSIFSDRIRPGASLRITEDRRGLFGVELDDPIGEAFRADIYSRLSIFGGQLFEQTIREVNKVRKERKFGGEDQVQHSLLIGGLQNLNSAFSLFLQNII